jgi:alpha-galactosidase
MTRPTITLVGAGGMSFGPTMVNDVVHTPALQGARMVLHDVNEERLLRAYRFAARLNAASGAPLVLDRTTDPAAALDGADFVISSAEFGRFAYWRQDHDVPNRHGARQIHGENGGPGAVFHSLRSIRNTLGICADIERYAPDAFLINLSNPMSRVTLAINRATSVRNVGMCHEGPIGVARICRMIGVDRRHVEAAASGINHFTFFTEFRDRRTGEDLLPRIRAHFGRKVYDFSPRSVWLTRQAMRFVPTGALAEQLYSPLVAHVVREYGLVPCSVDSHIGEYLPFALDVADYHPDGVSFFQRVDEFTERLATWASTTRVPLPLHLAGHSLEEVAPIIAAMWTGEPRRIMATNVPNRGYLADVADGAIVEVGATVDADGVHPDSMSPLGEPLAGWVGTQVALQDLVVDAALTGDPDVALQAVLDDPNSPSDPDACRAMFDELWALQSSELPLSAPGGGRARE